MMREQRKLLEEDEQTKLVMRALRGANTNEDDFQDANVRMKVVEMREGEKDLPTTYDPDALADYFGKRPGACSLACCRSFHLCFILDWSRVGCCPW